MSKNYKIAVLPGDGTGPEVIAEAVKVLDAAGKKFGFTTDKKYFNWGGEHYLATGETLPADAKEQLSKFDAVLLGAIGHPKVKPGVLEKGILLKLRFDLDQYINLRPVKLYPGVETPLANKKPEDIDYVVSGKTPAASTPAWAATSRSTRLTKSPARTGSTPARRSTAV